MYINSFTPKIDFPWVTIGFDHFLIISCPDNRSIGTWTR